MLLLLLLLNFFLHISHSFSLWVSVILCNEHEPCTIAFYIDFFVSTCIGLLNYDQNTANAFGCYYVSIAVFAFVLFFSTNSVLFGCKWVLVNGAHLFICFVENEMEKNMRIRVNIILLKNAKDMHRHESNLIELNSILGFVMRTFLDYDLALYLVLKWNYQVNLSPYAFKLRI